MLPKQSERGAAAVEFALLVPILIMLLLGIMEFGRAYNVQVTLTHAAREGARSMAINKNQDTARTAVKNATSHLSPALEDGHIAFSQPVCQANAQTTVTISYNLSTMTGIAGPFAMAGRGTMLCGG